MSQTPEKKMRVHSSSFGLEGIPKDVSYTLLSEDRAQQFHGQTLDRLNERGGMSVLELIYNIQGGDRNKIWGRATVDDVKLLNDLIANRTDNRIQALLKQLSERDATIEKQAKLLTEINLLIDDRGYSGQEFRREVQRLINDFGQKRPMNPNL